jgi:hypothetical protein
MYELLLITTATITCNLCLTTTTKKIMSKKISDGNYIVVENVTYIVVTYEIGYR